MTFRIKFLLFVSICVPPNNPITALGATSFPGYHSFPKWAIPKKNTVTQGCMSLSTYYLEYGSHLARLHHHCRRRLRRVYSPTSNTASHDNHEKINSWVSFCFPYEYGASLGSPMGCRSSAISSNPGLGNCAAFLDKTLHSHSASLHPGV